MVRDFAPNIERSSLYLTWNYQRSWKRQQSMGLTVTVTSIVLSLAVPHPLVSYMLVCVAAGVCYWADSLTPHVESARRRVEDYQAVSDEAYVQTTYQEMVEPVGSASRAKEAELIDAAEYFRKAGKNWRTHLALLSPTDTGKSSTLNYLLSEVTAESECMVVAIEPKGAKWASLPQENVIRVGFRPTREEALIIIRTLEKVLDEAQAYVNGESQRKYRIIVILEEWLSLYATLDLGSQEEKKLAKRLKRSVTSFVGVGRGANCQLILISQSPNVSDIGVTGGVRRNLRCMVLGSRLGGFEAIEATTENRSMVPKSLEDRILREFEQAKTGLKNNRHPLVMTNLSGEYRVFPTEFMSEADIDSLAITSLPIAAEFLPGSTAPPVAQAKAKPQAESQSEPTPAVTEADLPPYDAQPTIREVEDAIAAYFVGRNPNKWLLVSQVKNYIPLLRDTNLTAQTLERICQELVSQGRLRLQPDASGKKKPRFGPVL